jgi:hypothetical protein
MLTDLLNFMQLTPWQYAAVLLVGLLIGIGKAGISGIVMVAVPILASVMGGKASTGLMTTIFILGDFFALKAYRRHVVWSEIRPMLPAAIGGIVLGSAVGMVLNDRQFKYLIATIVLICLILMVIQEVKGANFKVPHSLWFIIPVGIISGFATMIGNAAGPIFAVYLLAIGLNKNNFLGTLTWFFLIINLTKFPIQIITWQNISWITIVIALSVLPAIYLGMKIGVHLVKAMNERTFRIMIIVMTALATVRLFF